MTKKECYELWSSSYCEVFKHGDIAEVSTKKFRKMFYDLFNVVVYMTHKKVVLEFNRKNTGYSLFSLTEKDLYSMPNDTCVAVKDLYYETYGNVSLNGKSFIHHRGFPAYSKANKLIVGNIFIKNIFLHLEEKQNG